MGSKFEFLGESSKVKLIFQWFPKKKTDKSIPVHQFKNNVFNTPFYLDSNITGGFLFRKTYNQN